VLDDYGQPMPHVRKEQVVHQWLTAQNVKAAADELGAEFGGYHADHGGGAGLNYSEFIPVLVKALKEQQEQIEELKSRVDAIPK